MFHIIWSNAANLAIIGNFFLNCIKHVTETRPKPNRRRPARRRPARRKPIRRQEPDHP
jgi:hypothetical protein